MNRSKHVLIGAIAALGGYGLYKYLKREKLTVEGALTTLFAGGFIGLVPDVLEPATSPNHRSFFHSIAFLLMLTQCNQKVWQSKKVTENQKLITLVLSAAYSSHLLADSTTERGLPLLV